MIKIRIGKKKSPCGESKKRGFGQGTPPKGEWYKKQEIYLEEETKLLRELTEDELERALAAVAEIDPDELAFNQIFGDKKRLVLISLCPTEIQMRADLLTCGLRCPTSAPEGTIMSIGKRVSSRGSALSNIRATKLKRNGCSARSRGKSALQPPNKRKSK